MINIYLNKKIDFFICGIYIPQIELYSIPVMNNKLDHAAWDEDDHNDNNIFLEQAAAHGQPDIVQNIMQSMFPPPIDYTDAMLEAAANGNPDILKSMLQTASGNSPLCMDCTKLYPVGLNEPIAIDIS